MKKWPDDAFAGYLAAMIDGEGHIEIVGAYAVRIRIANTVKPTLDAMVARLGFGRTIEYARPKDRGYKRLYCLEVSNAIDVRRLFDVCGPYMHMKRDQMDAALAVVSRIEGEVVRIDERNRSILAAIAAGRVQIDIAKEYGVSPQLISRIKKGHTWSSVISGHRARSLAKRFPHTADQSFRLHGEPK